MRGSSHRLSRCPGAGRRAHNPPMVDARDASAPPAGQPAPQALAGVRVLDLSRVLAGPWCTQVLADLGADVIKVERPPGDGHPAATTPAAGARPSSRTRDGRETAEAAYYLGTNRNKRSITIDLATPEGAALVRTMAARCGRPGRELQGRRHGPPRPRRRRAARAQPAPRLLLDHRLRPDRPLPRPRRLRLRGPGHGRADERHRPVARRDRRRRARRRAAEGRRRRRRPVHRHVRRDRDPGRAAPPRRHRPGPGDRHGPARHPGGDARQPRRRLPRHRRRAAARRQRPPEHRAVPGVRGRRRAPDPGGRQRRPVRPLLRRRRLRRARARSALRPQRRSRPRIGRRWCRCWRRR